MSNQPLPDVYYRIQNLDYANFLELSKPRDGGKVVLRVKKEDVDKQQVKSSKPTWQITPDSHCDSLRQWTFEAVSPGSYLYRIRNVASILKPPALYLDVDISASGSTSVEVTRDAGTAAKWEVDSDTTNNLTCVVWALHYNLITHSIATGYRFRIPKKRGRRDFYLQTTPTVYASHISDIMSTTIENDRLLYRIRCPYHPPLVLMSILMYVKILLYPISTEISVECGR